jgi:single-strand DNA-binding protein
MGIANIEVVGNLGRDPELRYTPNGQSVTNFSIGVSHSKPDGAGGWKDEGTDWFTITAWGEMGERWAQDLHKGDKVIVWGRFRRRDYTGQRGPGTSLDITMTSCLVVSAKADRPSNGQSRPAAPIGDEDLTRAPVHAGASAAPDDPLDDLPF